MAFFSKATANSESISGNILLCPVCEEEYDDPKRLPCMHTVCLGCLESVVPENALIMKCPIDDQELPMPKGGVSVLPSDLKIIRLLELSSGDQTTNKPKTPKKPKRPVSEETKKKPVVRGQVAATLEEEAELVRKLFTQTADKIREAVSDKEKEILKEIDDLVNKQLRKAASEASFSNGTESCGNEGNGAGKDESDSSKKHPSFIIDLTPSRKLLQMAREDGLGNIKFGLKSTTPSPAEKPIPVNKPIPSASANASTKSGGTAEIINTVNLPNRYKRSFGPSAVAVSHAGHVAVSDFGSECILLFDPEGNFVKKIGGESGDAGLEGPDGLAFLPDNNLVVSDGPLDGLQSIKLYKPTGEYLKTLFELDTSDGEELYFGRVTIDSENRIILACSGEDPRIRIFDSNGNFKFQFGGGSLSGPQKAVFFDDQFFVSDSDGGRQRSCIKIFDKTGTFVSSFNESKLNVGEQDNMGLDVTYPIHIAVHKGIILAYHGLCSKILLFKPDGTFVIEYRAVSGIRDMSVYDNGNIIVTCGEESMLPRSVQVMKSL